MRASVVLVAFVVATGAVVWVGAIGFRDHTSHVDCGVPLAAAVHAKKVPRIAGAGDLRLTDACVGEARTRIVIAVVVVLASAAVATVVLRSRRGYAAGHG